jgi:aryl sulfotransferase
MADGARWERFAFRADDVVISTPSKCGTTWMQMIVGMLLLHRTDLGAPISSISPWLDMLIHTDDEVFTLLEDQRQPAGEVVTGSLLCVVGLSSTLRVDET